MNAAGGNTALSRRILIAALPRGATVCKYRHSNFSGGHLKLRNSIRGSGKKIFPCWFAKEFVNIALSLRRKSLTVSWLSRY
jgi:hypothetical protein